VTDQPAALSLREQLALPFFYMRFGPTGSSGSHTNLVYSARLSGPLDVDRLRAAFETLTRETPELRGYFSGPDAPPARWTSDQLPPFEFIDASGRPADFKAAGQVGGIGLETARKRVRAMVERLAADPAVPVGEVTGRALA